MYDMTSPRPQLLLNLVLSAAHFNASWRLPEVDTRHLYDFSLYADIARRAEAVNIHSIFVADSLALQRESVATRGVRGYEPASFLSALAAVTRQIGLIGTFSTTFNEPYNLARVLTSLDRLSHGRAGWNIVTSTLDSEAQNFGLDTLPEHDGRYERAEEFLAVAKALWTSFEEESYVADKERGVLFDPDKVHEIHHSGTYYKVRGPLNSHRTPQVWPVLCQAGASEAGRDFAGKHAEIIYSRSSTIEDAVAYRNDLRARAERSGRAPDSIKVFVSTDLSLGATTTEAEDFAARVRELEPHRDELLAVREMTGWDLTDLADAAAIPPLPNPETVNNFRTQITNLTQLIARQGFTTVGDLRSHFRKARFWSGWVGSVDAIADRLEEWFSAGAADGFTLSGDIVPGHGVYTIFDDLVPELQRRGLFQTEYRGTTLREHYGLPPIGRASKVKNYTLHPNDLYLIDNTIAVE
jgi:FMN-dependent oxidoreductase (nitrilotriacetate monooxygenase family)